MATKQIYTLYAELRDYEPKIWRRFEVVSNINIARLGYIIMTLFEMQAAHLFCFDVPFSENYRIRMAKTNSQEDLEKIIKIFFDENPTYKNLRLELFNERAYHAPDAKDATKALLKNTINQIGERLHFTYDFGDNWEIDITLLEVSTDTETSNSELLRVLEGSGFGIIEDCGGVPGLTDIAAAYKKKSGRAYREYCEWLDMPDLDMNSFDLDDMNFRLKKLPKIFAEIYEKELMPTQQSIDLILRKYHNC